MVKFEKVGDTDVGLDTYEITDVELLNFEGVTFLELEDCQWWLWEFGDIAYLIRTEEGSLND